MSSWIGPVLQLLKMRVVAPKYLMRKDVMIYFYNFDTRYLANILSVNEKVPLLKFRYFENYKRHLDSYFTFRVSDQLQKRLEQ